MFNHSKPLFACIAMLAFSACGEAPVAKFLQPSASLHGAGAINGEAYRAHVATLASDEFGGRGPASPGEELTVDYLVNAFRKLGLQPGNGSSYIQEVPLISVEVSLLICCIRRIASLLPLSPSCRKIPSGGN